MEELFKVPVIEAYGMTEAAHQIASNPLPPAERKLGSVGNAAGPEVAIMGASAGLLPPGERGEIVVRGPNITSGYEKNTAANATVFTEGWFRTGDQGYLDEKGYLFITGRLKEMINRGGEKISPREIDEALLDDPDILQAVAFAVPHPTLGEDVAAAVVLGADRQLTEPMIRESLVERLAAYKIPSRIIIVDEIPKGATGKLQRIGLAEKFADQLGAGWSAPQGEIEAKLAQVYAEVLGVEQVSTTENFFTLGGDSLRAFQVIARIRAALDVNLSIGTIFMKPTVFELARVIQEAKDVPG
jgi:acyl-CoA synthetase (AMP-forming)/AMP-acid ligase II/aryl carrier-like protein